jgi:type I restriction enzyme S subunit
MSINRVKFGDVALNLNETVRSGAEHSLTRVVGLEHIDSGDPELRRWDELSSLPDGTSFTRVFRRGQVLFGKRRAYQRKVAVASFDGICSSDILVFTPRSKDLHPDFLLYVVQSDGFFAHALQTSSGSLSPRTRWQDLATFEFELPSIEEQHRIVEMMTAVDEHIESLRHQLDVLQTTRKSVLHHLLNAGGEGWIQTTMGEVAEASWGNTAVTKAQYQESGFVAFSASGPDGFLDWFEHDSSGVVLSAIGALCGKTWLAEGKWTPIKNTIWIKSSSDACLTSFIYNLSQTANFWPIRGQAQPFIALGDVRSLSINLPPLTEQQCIVDEVSKIDGLIQGTNSALASTQQLRSALLNKEIS